MPEAVNSSEAGEVRTGADRLLELVKASREISMTAAAKELNVPAQNVEALANFLEEDGLVAIKYKFTTPYLAIPESAEVKKLVDDMPKDNSDEGLKAEISRMLDILSKAGEEKLSGEFGMLKETYDALISKIREASEKLMEDAKLSPQKKAQLNDLIKGLGTELESASEDASNGKFDRASLTYSKLYLETKKAIDELHDMYDQMLLVQALRKSEDYKDILEKAYELMRGGKVTESMELYERLKFADENLAREFVAKKLQMDRDLAKFNKDLAKSIDRINMQKLNNASGRVGILLNAGGQLLKKAEFKKAETYYLAIKSEYEKLPPGFPEEKKELQRKILDFFSSLTTQRERAINGRFDQISRQIAVLLKEISELLKENNVVEAVADYRELKQLYNALPSKGFLKEKSGLQERILPLYTQITSLYAQDSLNRLKSKSAEIYAQLNAMNRQTEKGELKEAEETYGRVKVMYSAMPKGFLHEETALQNQIVQSYETMLRKAKQIEQEKIAETLAAIRKLLVQADNQLKKRDYDGCNDTYFRIIGLYNTIPSGFTTQKSEVRSNIIRLYHTLLRFTKGQGQAMPETQEDVARRATSFAISEIAQLILEVHKGIAAGNFQVLQESIPRFDALSKLVPDLSVANAEIFSKFNDIKEEVELLENASGLKQYFESGQTQQLKRALDNIRKKKGALSRSYPGDGPLFDFITRKYEEYMPKLISLASQPVPEAPQVQAGSSTAASLKTAVAQSQAGEESAAGGSQTSMEQEVDEVEKKIEDLKTLSRATVRLPPEAQ